LGTAILVVTLLSGCSAWQEVASHEDWSLYVKPGGNVDAESFTELFDPAIAAVEAQLGPFEHPVEIHVWNGGVDLQSGTRGRIQTGDDAGLVDSDLGLARVRAFHVKRDAFGPGGVFLGEPSPGAVVHELVHARLAELSPTPPLWFEEGLAMLLADGQLVRTSPDAPRWVHDGLCAWPRSVLTTDPPTDDELASILALESGDEHTVEENLLVHFIGWAIVFDLYRESPDAGWRTWLTTFEGDPTSARTRLERSLNRGTFLVWLHAHLTDPEPGIRAASARGTWRGADSSSLQLLSSALRYESDPTVRATLAINLLAAAGEGRYAGMGRWNGLRLPIAVLEHLEFGTPADREAVTRLLSGYRGEAPRGTIETAFRDLEAYWQE
jgi:hypothetical protein